MKFPIFNLSYPEWEETVIQEFRMDDDLYISNDHSFFEKYFLGQTFVDSEGQLFKLTGFHDFTITKLFFFKSYRKKLIFEKLNKVLSFEELKNELMERCYTLELEEVKRLFRSYLDESTSIVDLLNKM